MTEHTGEEQAEGAPAGRFRKAQSGNPNGKPAGARNRMTLALEKLLDGEARQITRQAISVAKAGDGVALRLVMDRVVPLRRGRAVVFDLPDVATAGDLSAGLSGILTAVATGQLTPDEGVQIGSILEQKRRALELVRLDERLAKLEAAAGKKRR